MDIKKLKETREQKGWTRKQLADKLAVSVKTVQSWEQGFRVPRPSALNMLTKLFEEDTNTKQIFNNFFGIALNMKPNIKIVRLYASEEKLNNFVKLLSNLDNDNNFLEINQFINFLKILKQ